MRVKFKSSSTLTPIVSMSKAAATSSGMGTSLNDNSSLLPARSKSASHGCVTTRPCRKNAWFSRNNCWPDISDAVRPLTN